MPTRPYFSKVRVAREQIAANAQSTYRRYLRVLKRAEKMGKVEVAAEGYKWLLEHTPAAEDGTRVLDISVDRPAPEKGYSGPSIALSFNMGGLTAPPQPHALPPAPAEDVIDAEIEREDV